MILTAGNEAQAHLYREQLAVRARLGMLGEFGEWRVIADLEGKRIGSGGSTIACLVEVLNCEGVGGNSHEWSERLRELRILIIHAGGDSRRLPAYGPCGKVFIPMPCESDSALGLTLFDYQLPIYAALPAPRPGRGQVVIASGDVLLDFRPTEVVWDELGITGLGCRAAPVRAARHGVYSVQSGGRIRRFMQKPTVDEQREIGAIDQYGEAVLDIGVFNFDGKSAVRLLELCGVVQGTRGQLTLRGDMREAIMSHGLDFYREICCVLGTETTLEEYTRAVRASGSRWPSDLLERIYQTVSSMPANVCVLKKCDFLHFGSTREILATGRQMAQSHQQRLGHVDDCLVMNSKWSAEIALPKGEAWIEGCVMQHPVALAMPNILVGVDIDEALSLPSHACLDVLPGRNRNGDAVNFVRCYHDDDPLQNDSARSQLGGLPLDSWISKAGIDALAVWDESVVANARCMWNARVFPAERAHADYRRWLWMFEPEKAKDNQFREWAAADRYSFEEMALLADVKAFHARRTAARSDSVRESLHRQFRSDSKFSSADLAHLLGDSNEPSLWLARLIAEVRWQAEHSDCNDPQQSFALSRVVHTLGSAIEMHLIGDEAATNAAFSRGTNLLPADDLQWLAGVGLGIAADTSARDWAERAKRLAFQHMRRQIISLGGDEPLCMNSLRPDEIVWGRAPARLDLGGGWTDTPPYALERGGCVLNAAVELNGQPPIQAFARVTRDLLIRVRSIDVGSQLELSDWDQLMNCAVASGEFSLVQAALSISGFSPRHGASLGDALRQFGGGLEITTLAAIPKGSGLGTSSIMGAVLLAVISRVLGRQLSPTELFYGVLRLEQTLTTGGGWQDQVGGSVGGVKLITTQPAMVPDAVIRYIPADVLDPHQNGGQTLLYYTGITRLAKNILQQVVGRYLDRDREAMRVLRGLHEIAAEVAEAIARKDIAEFGRLIDQVWELNKRLDPDSSNERIEAMLGRVRPWIYGAKLLGAGGGGFLLLVCKSTADAARVREELDGNPPNRRARFFDFAVTQGGLNVSVC